MHIQQWTVTFSRIRITSTNKIEEYRIPNEIEEWRIHRTDHLATQVKHELQSILQERDSEDQKIETAPSCIF